jgi:hypothetical protein
MGAMNATQTNQIAEVVQRVQSWPPPMRIALARQILETLENAHRQPSPRLPRGLLAAEIAAMVQTDKPAPDDSTVKEWIEDYRMEKYGK